MASTPSAAAESQEEILHSEPGGDLEGTAPYGPEEVFGFGEDAFCINDWTQQGGTYRCMSLPDEGCDRSNLVHNVYQFRMATL